MCVLKNKLPVLQNLPLLHWSPWVTKLGLCAHCFHLLLLDFDIWSGKVLSLSLWIAHSLGLIQCQTKPAILLWGFKSQAPLAALEYILLVIQDLSENACFPLASLNIVQIPSACRGQQRAAESSRGQQRAAEGSKGQQRAADALEPELEELNLVFRHHVVSGN